MSLSRDLSSYCPPQKLWDRVGKDFSIPEGCSTCCKSWVEPHGWWDPQQLLSRSVVSWGVLAMGRPLTTSSLPSLSLSLSLQTAQELLVSWRRVRVDTQAPCREPQAHASCMDRQCWRQAGTGTCGCSLAPGSRPGSCCQLHLTFPSCECVSSGAGVCKGPKRLRSTKKRKTEVEELKMPPKLVSSRQCPCRLGEPLLLALSCLLAAPQLCPSSLPSHLAQVTQPVSPSQHLHGYSFTSESLWDLTQHPQHTLDLRPYHPL